MDTTELSGLWLLLYCVGLMLAFGLGAIKGGQR